MLTVDANHWSNWVREEFIPQINALGECLLRRVLPGFSNISEEADRVRDEVYGRLAQCADPDADHYSALDAAFEGSLSFCVLMDNVKQGTINMFATGLYHAFEQQLLVFCRRAIFGPDDERGSKPKYAYEAVPLLQKVGLDPNQFQSWPTVFNELRQIANVVKHAEGDSANKLRAIRPDLFHDLGEAAGPRGLAVDQPLMGDGIYVSVEEFSSKVQAVVAFWSEFAARLDGING